MKSPRPDPRKTLGELGERAVAKCYQKEGYVVVARNWRTRNGELDLVLRLGPTIVFCEVKTRSSNKFGEPVEAVGEKKAEKIRSLALEYLQQSGDSYSEMRFDVASVMKQPDGSFAVGLIQDAF